MTTLRNISALLVIALIAGCSSPKSSEIDITENPESLVGTWKIQSYISPDSDTREWITYSSNIVKEKHITPTHFIWLRYDEDTDQLLQMGGGTYQYEGSSYVEHVEFFYPPSSSYLGQYNVFDANFEDAKWYLTGYAKETEFDAETAQTIVADSIRIEEIWDRVQPSENASPEMIGTWELLSYRENSEGPELNYPDFVNYIKLLTPTHFCWVQYNDEGDEVSGTGAGTYRIEGDTYIENPQMFYSSRQALMGTEIHFTRNIDGNRWAHYAESVTRNGEQLKDVYIDEIWAKIGNY